MWRAADWENPFTPEKLKAEHNDFSDVEEAYEAGAEAMLKGLLSQSHQNWLATSDGEKCKGRWVFVPVEEKGNKLWES